MLSRIETENRNGSSWTTPTDRAQRAERHVADVVAVDLDGPTADVVEPGEQPGDGRLARAGLTDDRDGLAGLDLEGEVAEDRRALACSEKLDVAERHAAFDGLEVDCVGALGDLGPLVEDLEDALGARLGALPHHDELAEHHERRLQHRRSRG